MDLLNEQDLREMVQSAEGPCVSIYMPTHPAGRETQQDPTRLKNHLREAEEHLQARGMRAQEIQEFLQPAQALIADRSFWERRCHGLAVFRSKQTFRHYCVPLETDDLVVVSDSFHIKPLLALLQGDGRFFVLALSQNDLRLLECSRYTVREVDVEGVPKSLAEAMKYEETWEPGDRYRPGNRGSAQMFTGHGAGSEDPKNQLKRYCQQVDRGLQDLLRERTAPLVLAAVDYLIPIYRDANSYPHLMPEGVVGNPDEQRPEELRDQAWRVVGPRFSKARHDAEDQYRQLAGSRSELVSRDIRTILPASYQGRVASLFVPRKIQQWGSYDPVNQNVDPHPEPRNGDKDLLDMAATQTFLMGGTVFAVEPEEVPDGATVAAVFRY